jgi:hypothetical protein
MTALRLATAACFLGHGTLALKNAPIFYSEWSNWIQSLLPAGDPTPSMYVLRVIGSIDVLVGLVFLLRAAPPRWAFAWAIGWGLATATSRLYFLGALHGDPWQHLVHPLAEMLVRTVNWAAPLALLRRDRRWVTGAVAAGALAHGLAYLATWLGPTYPFEPLKTGEPLWLFHVDGALALAALVLLGRPRGALLALASMALGEAIDLASVAWPRGAFGIVLQLAEHQPIYVCFALYALARLPRLPRGASPLLAATAAVVAACDSSGFSGSSGGPRSPDDDAPPIAETDDAAACEPADEASLALADAKCTIQANGSQPTFGTYATVVTSPAPCDFRLPSVTVSGYDGGAYGGYGGYAYGDPTFGPMPAPQKVTLPTGTYWSAAAYPGYDQPEHPFALGAPPANAPWIDNGFLLVQPDGKTYLLIDAGFANRGTPEFRDAATIANQLSQSLGFGATKLLRPETTTTFKKGSVIALYDDTPDMAGEIDVHALVASSKKAPSAKAEEDDETERPRACGAGR